MPTGNENAGNGRPPAFANIISTKRSGHHALVTWLGKGWPGRTAFVNNAVIGPDLEARIAEAGRAFREGVEAGGVGATTIFNYEGVSLAGVGKAVAWQRATGAPVRNLVFLRDPLNTAASLLQRKAVAYLDIVMVLRQLFALKAWLEVARAGQAGELSGTDFEIAFYNRWLGDSECREAMATSFGLTSAERSGAVEGYGGGSSFGDMTDVDDGAAAQLVNRWRKHENSSLFRALVSHREFAEIFLNEARGEIADSFGGNDGDVARAEYLSSLVQGRRPHAYADRMIAGMARRLEFYEQIEARSASGKKVLILSAHLAALTGR